MSDGRNATRQRAATYTWGSQWTAPSSSWGHQLAKQWGGPATQWNAASASDAQEAYQTVVEDAVTKVSEDDGVPLENFRLKHTAYLYPGTNVAKFMRIKIYVRNRRGHWVKAVDQSTRDNATALAGGRSDPTSTRGTLQIDFENQLRRALGGKAAPTGKGTHGKKVTSGSTAWRPTGPPTRTRVPAAPSGGWCFLTSACIEARGLADDCRELTVLRAFRDGYMRSLPQGEELIAEYYRIAPAIVEQIQCSDSRLEVLDRLYQDLVLPCVELIREGKNEEALENYCRHVRLLCEKYPASRAEGLSLAASAAD